MEGYQAELVVVKQELSDIEGELDQLLQRQSDLLDKKDELEKIIKQSTSAVAQPLSNTKWESSDFKWSKNLAEKMKSVFHMSRLRPMQLQTMNVTMSGKDCILIMPTGGGKSLCFQLPALLCDGITLVVSPLVSLMEDQVMALRGYNIDCNKLNAATSKEELKQVQDAMTDKKATLKLLYVTPEKLAKSKRFMAKLEKMYQVGRFARLVIDEVHCCSQWGHDFRPDYKFLGIMKRQFPGVPILGLTATATTQVLDDVKKILNIQDCQLFKASFNRPNLFYELYHGGQCTYPCILVYPPPVLYNILSKPLTAFSQRINSLVREKPSAHKEVMDDIVKLISSRFRNQSGIIYTFSKKETEDVAMELQSRGVKAGCYHADLTAKERSRVHRAWIENAIQVVVATIAFGMGIDKPDVRFVIHHSLSKSMENFYQESGRAGRDEKKSHCILYYRFQDVFRQSSMVMSEQTGLRNLYGIMDYCTNIGKCRRSMIARYFGEVWESSQCNKMCDHCNSNYTIEKKDVTKLCSSVLKLIDNANSANQRLTAIKLMDAWQGKGATFLRVKGTDTNTDRDKLERILAHMLLKNYIREDFHFTPYSTITYLVAGNNTSRITSGDQKIFLDVPGKKKSGTEDNAINSSSTSYGFKNSSTDKPKLVVINNKKSAFTSFTGGQSQSLSDTNGAERVVLKKEPSDLIHLKKRKKQIRESDSDSDGLDFGATEDRSNFKKQKSGDLSSKHKRSESNGSSKHKNDKRNSLITDDVMDLTSDTEESHKKGDESIVLGKKKPIPITDSDSDFE